MGSLIIAGGICCSAATAYAAAIVAGTGNGEHGTQVTVNVTLSTAGASVAGTINDITFDKTKISIPATTTGNCSVTTATSCTTDANCPALPPPYTGNEPCVNLTNAPACTVNPAIGKGGFFSFVQSGAGIRAVILGLTANPATAIPDGSTLYSCKVDIAAGTANGTVALAVSNTQAGNPSGALVTPTTGTDGAVIVGPPSGCCGDSNLDRAISTGEATNAVLALVNRDVSKNPKADCNSDGAVSTGEATKVILNLVNRVCNQ